MPKLRETKSVFYYTSSSSRKSIKSYYDQLSKEGVIPPGFPHDKEVHCGIGIYNHALGKVEYVLEGSGSRKGELVLYKNRESTLDKLNNSGCLKSVDERFVHGFWTEAYKIKRYPVTADAGLASQLFDEFYEHFNKLSEKEPVSYEAGRIDCQTIVHYLLRSLTGTPFASPHGEYTLGWGDGLQSPHEISSQKSAESTLSKAT